MKNLNSAHLLLLVLVGSSQVIQNHEIVRLAAATPDMPHAQCPIFVYHQYLAIFLITNITSHFTSLHDRPDRILTKKEICLFVTIGLCFI